MVCEPFIRQKKKKSLTLKKSINQPRPKKKVTTPRLVRFGVLFGGGDGGVGVRLFYDPILPQFCFWEVLL